MLSRLRPIATLGLLAALPAAFTAPAPSAPSEPFAPAHAAPAPPADAAPSDGAAPADDIQALAGEWQYVRDLTEGRPEEDQGPPMSARITLRVEERSVVWERTRGDEHIMIDGTVLEQDKDTATETRRGAWKDGVLEYVIETVNKADGAVLMLIHREFRVTPDGLQIRVVLDDTTQPGSLALYRHPDDIEPATPAAATLADLAWLAGDWVGTRGTSSIEERWGPPRGGSMFGVSRTVKGERLTAFEYLRIAEREGGLVYVAQPNGGEPTEFVLSELGAQRAVFDNPRHEYPQRIVYWLSADGALSASIGFLHGGRPTVFEFTRESP